MAKPSRLVCSHPTSTFASRSMFNIVSIAMQTLMQRLGSDPFSGVCACIAIDAMLNFDSDVDTNAKCEQSITCRIGNTLIFFVFCFVLFLCLYFTTRKLKDKIKQLQMN